MKRKRTTVFYIAEKKNPTGHLNGKFMHAGELSEKSAKKLARKHAKRRGFKLKEIQTIIVVQRKRNEKE